MENLTKEQKEKLYDLIKAEKPELMPLLDVLENMNETLLMLVKKEHPMVERPEVQKVSFEGISTVTLKGDKGDPGKDAEPPTKEDLTALIKPLIPKPIPGEKGRDGRDGKDGVGRDGKDGKDADETKIVEKIERDLPQLGERIRDGLELLQGEERLDKKAIKGLEEDLKRIENLPRGGFTRRVYQPKRDNFTGDGSTRTFTLSRETIDADSVMVWCTDFPIILAPGTDFTVANKVLTFSSSFPAPSNGATIVVIYYV